MIKENEEIDSNALSDIFPTIDLNKDDDDDDSEIEDPDDPDKPDDPDDPDKPAPPPPPPDSPPCCLFHVLPARPSLLRLNLRALWTDHRHSFRES